MKKPNKKGKNKWHILKQIFYPNKWNIFVTALLYFSNYISFFGLIFNYPIFYFYWNYTLNQFQSTILFIAHLVYLYVIACTIVKLLK